MTQGFAKGWGTPFPVGSVFLSVVATNPNTLLGYGTWTQIAQGQVLIGEKDTDSDFNAAEKTGGAKTHTLTETEMPVHSHTPTNMYTYTGAYSLASPPEGSGMQNVAPGSAGGGQPHSILNPYFVVYVWKRTA